MTPIPRLCAYCLIVSRWFSVEYCWCSVDMRTYSAARISGVARMTEGSGERCVFMFSKASTLMQLFYKVGGDSVSKRCSFRCVFDHCIQSSLQCNEFCMGKDVLFFTRLAWVNQPNCCCQRS